MDNPRDLIEALANAPFLTPGEIAEINELSCVLVVAGELAPFQTHRLMRLWEEKGRLGS